jgi:hypothetical protein
MDREGFPADDANFKLVITHNVVSKSFSCEGHDKNLLVSMGMLVYAEQLIRMEIAKRRAIEEMQNAPRIQVAPRLVE